MSRLADAVIPEFRPDWELPKWEWDVPRNVGIVGGVITLGILGYVMYKMLNDEEEELE